jgi:hypothetical protein
VTGLSAPKSVAVDATNLYVSDPGTNTVWQINKTTLAQTPLGTGQANPGHVAVDGTYAYWSSAGGQAILRAPIGAGTAFQPIYSTAAGDALLAVDDADVYWIDQNGMHDAPKAGGGTVRDIGKSATTPNVQTNALSQDATTLYGVFYWSFPNALASVGRLDKATGALTLDGAESGQTGSLIGAVVDANNLYYIEAYGTSDPSMPGPPVTIPAARLWREAKTAGGPRYNDEVSPPAQGQFLRMAADGCTVYWATGTNIYRASPGGSPPHVLTSAATTAGEIVLDDSYVYWVDQSWIGRVPR